MKPSARNTRWIKAGSLVLVVVLAAMWIVRGCALSREEKSQILARYRQMVTALSVGDTNAALALFAPEFRRDAPGKLGLLDTFAKPLNPQSDLDFSDDQATVCPRPLTHYGIIPGGHRVEMVKRDGEWFFTGKVYID